MDSIRSMGSDVRTTQTAAPSAPSRPQAPTRAAKAARAAAERNASSFKPATSLSQKGLDLIKGFEGLRLRAYRDPAGVWTIGYGHTGGVKPGQVITRARAEELLRADTGWTPCAAT